jgi:DNA-binding HxlR family transcriptional regulator
MRDVRELVSHPYVVEVLDALSGGPMTLADLRASVPSARRGLTVALRILAAHGLVAAAGGGSWDNIARGNTVYLHTDRGQALFETLSRMSAWTTMLENDATTSPDGSAPRQGLPPDR